MEMLLSDFVLVIPGWIKLTLAFAVFLGLIFAVTTTTIIVWFIGTKK